MQSKVHSTSVDNDGRQSLQSRERKKKKENATTGASAASVRALASRMFAFYFRAPAKAFFRTRVDYLAFARSINPHVQANEAWSWRMSTPWLLGHAIRVHGWRFVPNNVLPPLLANVSVGAVLYTTYLQTLGSLHHPASASLKRVFPPPPVIATFSAGFGAGIVQAVIATPLDALQLRFKANELLDGRYKHMWDYGLRKSKAVGFRGLYAGLSLSLLKDSLGFGAFFATFEYIKAQCFYAFVTRYYGNIQPHMIGTFYQEGPDSSQGVKTIKPYFAVEPSFLLLAGILASITLQLIQQPLTRFQRIYFGSLQSLDRLSKGQMSRKQQQKNSKVAYHKTYEKCVAQARTSGGWRIWMYKGLIMNTLKQVPSTSAGLVIFEMVRRRYADETTAVRIEKDGYDILLT